MARPEEHTLEEHTLLSLTKTEQTLSWEPEQPSLLNYPNPAEVPYHVAEVPYRGQVHSSRFLANLSCKLTIGHLPEKLN